MNRLPKATIFAALIVVGQLATSPAVAAHWEIYDNGAWTQNGTVMFTGATAVTVAATPLPCSSVILSWTLNSGVFSITGALFGTSMACADITPLNLPWGVCPPVSITGSTSVRVTFGAIGCPNATALKTAMPPTSCLGGVANGTMTNANPNGPPTSFNALAFTTTFTSGACTMFKTNPSMISSKPIRAVP